MKIKSRGKLLSALLIFSAFTLGFDMVSFVAKGSWHANPLRFIEYPLWYNYYYLVQVLFTSALLWCIFIGKRWAVYIFFTKVLVSLTVDTLFRDWNYAFAGSQRIYLLYPNIQTYNIWLITLSLLFYAAFAFAIYRSWEFFR